ncbi:Os06g0539066 [Oryza sativa Japonica Group]|uniref:Os06g0539066 protein n=2 Tax=Oryza sativa subsp. japonica TaxID=39947 RepID=C7J3A0_ORYSJ|nr:Os06g0539066 [Oryza sativa Japonica Group]BAS98117.1 Os06g0539066 [Oryza sativa Japonica Group]|eukprot:NP_001174836.1 Os06g0539066 [Oryza sativa Japonica Group]
MLMAGGWQWRRRFLAKSAQFPASEGIAHVSHYDSMQHAAFRETAKHCGLRRETAKTGWGSTVKLGAFESSGTQCYGRRNTDVGRGEYCQTINRNTDD